MVWMLIPDKNNTYTISRIQLANKQTVPALHHGEQDSIEKVNYIAREGWRSKW